MKLFKNNRYISRLLPRTALTPAQTNPSPKPGCVPLRLIALCYREDDGGGFYAEIPGMPGCYSCGDTLVETEANIAEAAEGLLDLFLEHHADRTPTVDELFVDAEPECDPVYFRAVLQHNHALLFPPETPEKPEKFGKVYPSILSVQQLEWETA